MTVKECLIAARKKVELPQQWAQGETAFQTGHSCSLLALEHSTVTLEESFQAKNYFYKAIGGQASIAEWNDAPERTHEDVLAAFDKAIELAGE